MGLSAQPFQASICTVGRYINLSISLGHLSLHSKLFQRPGVTHSSQDIFIDPASILVSLRTTTSSFLSFILYNGATAYSGCLLCVRHLAGIPGHHSGFVISFVSTFM